MELQTYRQQHAKHCSGMPETLQYAESKLHCDSRYRSIIGQLDAIIESLQQQPDRKLTAELDKLLDSIMAHISSENNVMSLLGYPGSTVHSNHHYYLFVITDDLNHSSAMGQDVTYEELANVRLLWMAHIQIYDRAFEEFLAF